MARLEFDHVNTALLVIDPYNDFISEGGLVWNRLKAVADANGCVTHMASVVSAARHARLRVFYALHRRYRSGDYADREMHAALKVNIPNYAHTVMTTAEIVEAL